MFGNTLTIAQRVMTQLIRDRRTIALIVIVPLVIASLVGVSVPDGLHRARRSALHRRPGPGFGPPGSGSRGAGTLRTRGRALKSGILIYVARLVLILGVFCLIILFFPRKIFAFAAGFSALLPVFLIEGAVALVRLKTWKS